MIGVGRIRGSTERSHRVVVRRGVHLAVALSCGATASIRAQTQVDVPGVVIDAGSRRGLEGVVLRIDGTDVSAASDADGAFVLRGLTFGTWTLRVRHIAYGEHEHPLTLGEGMSFSLEIRLDPEAIELDPVLVEAPTTRAQAERARGSSRNVVERPQIEAALGVSRHLGDLIRQTIPGVRLRQSNNLVGTDVCIEFRSASDISLLETRGCNHPLLLLDGVQVSDPNFAYGTIGLNTIQRIEVLPPGEAGARYGTGSLYGVILVETRDPRARDPTGARVATARRGFDTFDWTLEPRGHNGLRAAGGALLGNAVGLAAGVAIGSVCFRVDELDQIVTECGSMGNVGAVIAAFTLPAAASALGGRLGGRTEGSIGRLWPAMVGAGMALLPGYVYSMSTVGRGSDTANAAGAALLILGTPLAVMVADRLFRTAR